jgi:hypothetical protein
MPIGNGLRRPGERLPTEVGVLPFAVAAIGRSRIFQRAHVVRRRHVSDFDLLSAFQLHNRRRGNAEGIKRKLELFFEIAEPPAESLGFVVAEDRSYCGSSTLISSSLLGTMF